MRRPLSFLLALVLIFLATPAWGAERHVHRTWLETVNRYRAQAGLPPVTEDPTLSKADAAHAKYMVRNDVVSHHEDPSLPYYSPEGDEAAVNSNVIAGPVSSAPDHVLVDFWMTGPFHALGIVRVGLTDVGFAVAHDDHGLKTAAALDVGHGIDEDAATSETVVWPGDGSTVRLRAYIGGEWPDPTAPCDGYEPPAGLPVLFQFEDSPSVTDYSITDSSGRELDVCEVDGSNYSNDKQGQEDFARTELGDANAAYLISRHPLKEGETYTASITSNGATTTSTFTVATTTPRKNQRR